MNYSEKLKDPRWQKKRLQVMERDEFTCRFCGAKDRTLNVHHLEYRSDPWDVPDCYLLTICEDCHEGEHTHRDAVEKDLLRELKLKGFSYSFLIELGAGIHFMQPFHVDGVMGSVLHFVMRDQEILAGLTDRYFDHLRATNPVPEPPLDDLPF